MQHTFRGLVWWCGVVSVVGFAIQACGNSGDSTGSAGGAGTGGDTGHNGATAGRSSGGGSNSAGSANGGSGTAGNANANAGAVGHAGEGGRNADAGAGGSSGAGGAEAIGCHISWTGAATGEADCTHRDICQKSFLSLSVHEPAPPPPPLTSIQLVYSPDTDLILGPFTAAGMDMVNCSIGTDDPELNFGAQFDKNNLVIGGTSMTGTLTELQFSTDPNDPCAGTPHGSLDAVLRQVTPAGVYGDKLLSLHADF